MNLTGKLRDYYGVYIPLHISCSVSQQAYGYATDNGVTCSVSPTTYTSLPSSAGHTSRGNNRTVAGHHTEGTMATVVCIQQRHGRITLFLRSTFPSRSTKDKDEQIPQGQNPLCALCLPTPTILYHGHCSGRRVQY